MGPVRRHGCTLLSFAVVVVASAWTAAHWGGLGDYPVDAGPGMTALLAGHVGAFFAHQPVMGDFSLLVRLPFAAVGKALGDGQLGIYRWGCLPCVLAAGLCGMLLSREAGRRGMPAPARLLLIGLCVYNPLVLSALSLGHTEEVLTGALSVAALVSALRGRGVLAALLLGMAIATKQTAVLFALPVLLALPRGCRRPLLIAGAVVVVLMAPMLIANPSAFRAAEASPFGTPSNVAVFSLWLPVSQSRSREVPTLGVIHAAYLPLSVARLTRPLVLLFGLLLPLLLALRRRDADRDALFGVLALILLLRGALDSQSAVYYHLPLLLALAAWDVWSGARVPWRLALASALSFGLFDRATMVLGNHTLSALYVGLTALAGASFVWAALRSRSPRRRVLRGPRVGPVVARA